MLKTITGLTLALLMNTAWALDVGSEAPQIFGKDINDEIFVLSRHVDKPKVLNLFWVECGPCKKEIPMLAGKAKQHPNVEFIVVHAEANAKTDTNYDLKQIQDYVAKLGAHPSTVVLGSPKLKQLYGVKGFPATYLLSADNKVEAVLSGFNEKTSAQLDAWLARQK